MSGLFSLGVMNNNMQTQTEQLAQARQWIAEAQNIIVLTGAGVSAESGIATFRDDASGYWAQFKPEDMASRAGFMRNPALVWRWYESRRESVRQAQPNAGHMALARWSAHHPAHMTLITQNVDGLHERAGSVGVLNLHGELRTNRWLNTPCNHCDMETVEAGEPPRCSFCGNMLRPAVVWFGEALPYQIWEAAETAANRCDLMVVVGTSAAVYPAAGLALRAKRQGARVVIVNPQASGLDDVADMRIQLPAAQVLPEIFAV